jgi:YggT family protein
MTSGPVTLLLTIYLFVLLLHVIFSWVPRPPEPIMPFVLGVRRLVEPVAAPLRRMIPPLRLGGVGLDLSIIVLFIGVRILMSITSRLGI